MYGGSGMWPRRSIASMTDEPSGEVVERRGLRQIAEAFLEGVDLNRQPVERVIVLINPILRGWVNYFGHGHASRCFSYVRDWVEKKVRRHLARNSKRHGFGWKRWSKSWIYRTLGLFSAYRVSYRPRQKALPA